MVCGQNSVAEFLNSVILADRAKRPCEVRLLVSLNAWFFTTLSERLAVSWNMSSCFAYASFIGEWTADSSMFGQAGTALRTANLACRHWI